MAHDNLLPLSACSFLVVNVVRFYSSLLPWCQHWLIVAWPVVDLSLLWLIVAWSLFVVADCCLVAPFFRGVVVVNLLLVVVTPSCCVVSVSSPEDNAPVLRQSRLSAVVLVSG